MKVVEIAGDECVAELRGVSTRARMDLVSDIQTGDYVIVHAGFAIEKLDEEEALETLNLLDQLTAAQDPPLLPLGED